MIWLSHWARWGGAVLLTVILVGFSLAKGKGLLFWGQEDIWASIQREGVLRVCMDASYPPFEDVDTAGHFYGLDVDLAQALAERWGVRAEFVNLSFDGLYDALRVKRCDLILSALPYDRTMTRDVLFTQPYFDAGQVLLVRVEETSVASLADLAGRRVGAELGTEGHHLLRTWNRYHPQQVEIIPFREMADLWRAFHLGELEALVCDQVSAYPLLQEGIARQAGPMLSSTPLVGATRPEGVRLVAEFNRAFETWQSDGTWRIFQERWLGQRAAWP